MLYALFGLVLLVFSLLSYLLSADKWLTIAQAVPGGALLIVALYLNLAELRERLGGEAGQRGLWFSTNVLGQSVAMIAILGAIAFVSRAYPIKWDWTETGIHTLSEASKNVLAQIPEGQKVEIYAFFADSAIARQLLEPYDYASERLEFKVVNPNDAPLLAEKLEVGADRVLVVCAGACETTQSSVKTTELTEQKITESIRSVISKRRKLYFVIGHDESDPASQEESGLAGIGYALGAENIEFTTLLLAQADKVPDDADAVVIAGPSNAIYDRELDALDAYLKKGGSVLLLADALRGNKLPEQLQRWGIELGSDVVVDRHIQLFGPPTTAVVADYGSHPVTKDMRRRLTLFNVARSVRPAAGAEADVTVLASTSPDSFAVSEKSVGEEIVVDPSKDKAGPIPLAVARTFKAPEPAPMPEGHVPVAAPKPGPDGRLIVVGDADFAQNRDVAQGANADLFLNMVSWLVGDENFITIDRKPRASRVRMTEQNMRLYSYLGLFIVPEALLMLGIWNWWRRRQAV